MVRNLSEHFEQLLVRISAGRKIDGLWVGSMEDKPRHGLRRVEEALQLIKDHDSIGYSRVIRHLDRIWVNIVPSANACYKLDLNACVFDERFVRSDLTPIEGIARAIVHEATHARLERLGISYTEERRVRIEAICLRRELAFLAKVPNATSLQGDVTRTLDWCAENPGHFSNDSLKDRHEKGSFDALRRLDTPEWVIKVVEKWHRARSPRTSRRAS